MKRFHVLTSVSLTAMLVAGLSSPASGQSPQSRVAPRQVTSATTPKRARIRPYTFTTTGKVVPPPYCESLGARGCVPLLCPPGATTTAYCVRPPVCAGAVRVRFKRLTRTISIRRVALRPDCRYRSRVAFRRAGLRGRLRVLVGFQGNSVLLPKRARTHTVRIDPLEPGERCGVRGTGSGEASQVDGTHVAGAGLAAASGLNPLRPGTVGWAAATIAQAAADPPEKSKVTVTPPGETPTETYDPKKKPKDIGVDSNGVALDAVTTANVVVGGDYGFVGCVLKDKKTNGLKITDYDLTAKLDPKKTLIPKNATKKLIAHEAGHVTIQDAVFKAVARDEVVAAFAGFVGMEFATQKAADAENEKRLEAAVAAIHAKMKAVGTAYDKTTDHGRDPKVADQAAAAKAELKKAGY